MVSRPGYARHLTNAPDKPEESKENKARYFPKCKVCYAAPKKGEGYCKECLELVGIATWSDSAKQVLRQRMYLARESRGEQIPEWLSSVLSAWLVQRRYSIVNRARRRTRRRTDA